MRRLSGVVVSNGFALREHSSAASWQEGQPRARTAMAASPSA